MPFFNYKCTHCSTEYEDLIIGMEKPVCPKCNKLTKQKKLLSAPRMFNGDLTDGKPSIRGK